jgi:DNA-binding response OmpR family regulator
MENCKLEIVLIEDDLALGAAISELFLISGFNVKWLKNGVEALNYLKKNIPDVIVSDLIMPLMDGEELFLKIREKNKFKAIPFILITANINEDVKYKLLENGVNDYILKPFKVKELVYKVNNVINFKKSIEKKNSPDPFSKVTIKLSEQDFITSLNTILIKDLHSKIDIDKLSKQLYISQSTLDKKIRKHTGKNISKYIREFKLEYAIKLINLGERNIQFLVDETGFKSFSYFSTSFKSYVNLAPRDYIKSIDQKKQFPSPVE